LPEAITGHINQGIVHFTIFCLRKIAALDHTRSYIYYITILNNAQEQHINKGHTVYTVHPEHTA
jgi:hypothetical protein